MLALFLGFLWSVTRIFLRAPAGRQRFNVLGALNAIPHELLTVTNDTYQVVATRAATGTVAVTNMGLFDAASGGNLFLKGDFSVINLVSGDSIQATFKAIFA